jgi:flagellar basal-body rod protein FlgG
MFSALWIAKTGLDAQRTHMNVVSNNLANVNTTAFKRGRASFEDLLYQNVRQAGGQSSQQTQLPSGLMLGTGVRTAGTEKIFSQGETTQTNNPMDVAIQGRGFFQVLMPDGTIAYTRAGDFQVNAQGQIVTNNGYQLQPGISLPPKAKSITIGNDGTITAQMPDQAEPTQVGTLQLADFVNPAGLEPHGQNLYLETGASGPPQTGTAGLNGLGTLQQGALESSNVNVVEELVNMIETQRSYEMNSKAISTSDKMLQYLNNNV